MSNLRVTLDQWLALQAVVDQGSFARAAEHLNRSQSSVSYAISRIEESLDVQVLEIKGRKAELTEIGKVLLARSRKITADAQELEEAAHHLQKGWEAELHLVVDAAFPRDTLFASLQEFSRSCSKTRLEYEEAILSGAEERLLSGKADLAISHRIPPDRIGDEIIQIEFLAVARPDHPLHKLDRALTLEDLNDHMQIVIRDSGSQHKESRGWLGAEQRWSVSSMDSAIQLLHNGMGFGWLPRHMIKPDLATGTLALLPLCEGQSYTASLYLLFGHRQFAGPATQQLAALLRQNAKQYG